ncbi:MAG: type II toxin-antitoxin system Phd/YefM family antitoxin [Spirochaetales bacterium]|nr:type II toxin-antitoxin system Phd/YefM family antitoxin [Spirochaetales bacterium]
MIQVNTHEAKSKLSYLLAKVETEHEKVRICRNGKPIAELIPIDQTQDSLQQNPELMGIIYNEDPTLPLSDEEWPEEYRTLMDH